MPAPILSSDIVPPEFWITPSNSLLASPEPTVSVGVPADVSTVPVPERALSVRLKPPRSSVPSSPMVTLEFGLIAPAARAWSVPLSTSVPPL